MGGALEYSKRVCIIEDYKRGLSCAAIARAHGRNYATVRVLCRRFDQQGEAGLVPRYDGCGQTEIRSDPLVYRAACFLKRRHPGWGAPLIHTILKRRYPEREFVSVRAMQAWFKRKRLTPAKSKPARPRKGRASQEHEVWQIDAKEHQTTANQKDACWLTVTDEYSTAVLVTPVFPPQAHEPSPSLSRPGRAL